VSSFGPTVGSLRGWRLISLALISLAAPLAAATTLSGFGTDGTLSLAGWLTGAGDEQPLEIALDEPLPLDLVEATRGEIAARQIEGQAAEQVNAALPFSPEQIEAARRFNLAGASTADMSRALHCLTQAIYYEAAYEPVEGRRAVAQVVLNRVRHPAFPNSVCGVVYDGASLPVCQFSFTCDGSLRRRPEQGAWAEAQRIAREALQGHVSAAVGTATHYHANYVSPYWAPRLTKLRQIGAHIFYRWPGGWGRTAAFSSRYSGIESIAASLAVGEGEAPAGAGEAALAATVDPTDRRAPQDVGGRLDVTKGWTLSIPAPDETRDTYAAAIDRQAGTAPASSTMSETR
jgi:spore germination cell wall hydrolase CwlJ-like protein